MSFYVSMEHKVMLSLLYLLLSNLSLRRKKISHHIRINGSWSNAVLPFHHLLLLCTANQLAEKMFFLVTRNQMKLEFFHCKMKHGVKQSLHNALQLALRKLNEI